MSAHAAQAIADDRSPCARRHCVNVSSQLLAAAYADCPGEPKSAATEEKQQNQSSCCFSVASCKCQAPSALGAQFRCSLSSVTEGRMPSSTTAAPCRTPRKGTPVAVAASTRRRAVDGSAISALITSTSVPHALIATSMLVAASVG